MIEDLHILLEEFRVDIVVQDLGQSLRVEHFQSCDPYNVWGFDVWELDIIFVIIEIERADTKTKGIWRTDIGHVMCRSIACISHYRARRFCDLCIE
jgi:hypothetical protein